MRKSTTDKMCVEDKRNCDGGECLGVREDHGGFIFHLIKDCKMPSAAYHRFNMKVLLLTSALFFFLFPSTQSLASTSLMQKAVEGDVIGVKQLITEGVDVNAHGDDATWNKTALMEAAERGHTEVVRVLIEAQAEINARDMYGDTAIMLAAWKKHPETVALLLKAGADVNAQNTGYGSTLLFFLIENGDIENLKTALNSDANIHVRNKAGHTLFLTTRRLKRTDLARILLQHHAKTSKDMGLYHAAENGFADVVNELIQQGANASYQMKEEDCCCPTWTPLMIAAAEGHPDVVRTLINAGAAVNAANLYGRTALMFAAQYGFDDILLALVEKGADVNLVSNDKEGLSALMAASARGRKGVVEILLKNGADVNAKSRQGMTSLDYALKGGHADVVQLFKAAGAK